MPREPKGTDKKFIDSPSEREFSGDFRSGGLCTVILWELKERSLLFESLADIVEDYLHLCAGND